MNRLKAFPYTFGMMTTCVLCAAIPTILNLCAIDVHRLPHYTVLLENSSAEHATNPIAIWNKIKYMSRFILDPMTSAHILMGMLESPFWASSLYVVSALAFFLLAIVFGPSGKRTWIILNLISMLLSLSAVCASSKSYGVHNIVPCLVFAVSAAAAAFQWSNENGAHWKRALLSGALLTFLSSNLLAYRALAMNSARVKPPYHHNLVQLFEFINERYAATHLTVALDWNVYYTKSLYGPREQAVLCLDGVSGGAYIKAQQIAENFGRNVIFIARNLRPERLNELSVVFPDIHRVSVPFDVGQWEVWQGSRNSSPVHLP